MCIHNYICMRIYIYIYVFIHIGDRNSIMAVQLASDGSAVRRLQQEIRKGGR